MGRLPIPWQQFGQPCVGVVCKLKSQPCVSGRNRGWLNIKCHAWRKAHAGPPALFAKPRTRKAPA